MDEESEKLSDMSVQLIPLINLISQKSMEKTEHQHPACKEEHKGSNIYQHSLDQLDSLSNLLLNLDDLQSLQHSIYNEEPMNDGHRHCFIKSNLFIGSINHVSRYSTFLDLDQFVVQWQQGFLMIFHPVAEVEVVKNEIGLLLNVCSFCPVICEVDFGHGDHFYDMEDYNDGQAANVAANGIVAVLFAGIDNLQAEWKYETEEPKHQ